MSELDETAIKATIMEALVHTREINPASESLDLKNLRILNSTCHYRYEKNPNVCGIPLWIKQAFRKKSIEITKGLPLSIFLANPPSKEERFCILDQNIAFSSIFEDAKFYYATYDSPTRGVRISEPRQFVEIKIDNELYLVDVLTKVMYKSSWFKEKYKFQETSSWTIKDLTGQGKLFYQQSIQEKLNLSEQLAGLKSLENNTNPAMAEKKFELEQSKFNYSKDWKEYNERLERLIHFKTDEFGHIVIVQEQMKRNLQKASGY